MITIFFNSGINRYPTSGRDKEKPEKQSAQMSISVFTLRKFIKMGMPHYRIGNKFLLDTNEIEPWFAKHFRKNADIDTDYLGKILDDALAKIDI